MNRGGDGGDGGDGVRVGTWPQGSGSPQVQLLACQLLGGIGGSPGDSQCPPKDCGAAEPGEPGMPARVLNGSLTKTSETSRRMESPSIAREGDTLTLSFYGKAGDDVSLAVRRRRLTGAAISPRGIGAVSADGPVHVGVIPGHGRLDWTTTVGDLGPNAALTLLLEPVFVDTQGASHAGNSFGLVLADSGAY